LNEELQSTNEELQATNEELETSNEELQSTNEELITVNEELQITASELSGRTGELTSVLQSTPLAILVTDSALQITQVTHAAGEMFGLRHPISNPHISQCTLPEGFPALAPICNETLKLGSTTSHEFNSKGAGVLLSCTPYFNIQGKILGLTLVVTEFPSLAREMEMILDTTDIHLMNRTKDGQILRISKASADALGLSRDEAVGKNLYDFIAPKDADRIRSLDQLTLENNTSDGPETVRLALPAMKHPLWLSTDRRPFLDPATSENTVYSIGTNITGVIASFDRAQALMEQFRRLEKLAGNGYWELDAKTRDVHWSSKVFELHGIPDGDKAPPYEDALSFYHPDDRARVSEAVDSLDGPLSEFRFIARLIQKGGKEIYVESHGVAIRDAYGDLQKIIGIFKEANPNDINSLGDFAKAGE